MMQLLVSYAEIFSVLLEWGNFQRKESLDF